MGRWSQHDSDDHRLPADLVRIAYDADTQQYTFRDTSSGKLYRSAPGAAYGTLHPVLDHLPARPSAFAPEGNHHSRHPSRSAAPETTFHDMLPAHAITTSPPKGGSRSLASANTFKRSQSTRVPSSSSHFNNSLHSRSKSVSDRTAHASPRGHKRANTTTGIKSSFSLVSAFKSLSRSLTTRRGRDRQEKSTDDDRTREYLRL